MALILSLLIVLVVIYMVSRGSEGSGVGFFKFLWKPVKFLLVILFWMVIGWIFLFVGINIFHSFYPPAPQIGGSPAGY